mgnify:CR=1 FL=1
MKKSVFTAGFFAALFLTLFLIGILLFGVVAFLPIGEYDTFPAVAVFLGLNLMAMMIVFGLGSLLARAMSVPCYTVSALLTVIYSAIQFAILLIGFDKLSVLTYIFWQLVLVFVYAAILLPITIIGIKANQHS